MRSAILAAAAFAVSAIAVPMEKRAVVTETAHEVVYVTQFYTVTGGQAKPTEQAAPEESSAEKPKNHYGHHVQWGNKPNWWGGKPNKGHGTTKKVTATWEPEPTSSPEPVHTKTKTASAPPAYSAPPSSGGSSPSGYAGVVVDQHNAHRSNHSASNIAWSSELASIAADIARTCVYEHNTEMGGGGYGQNIAAGVDESGIDRVITDMFYNGEVNYYNGLYGQASPDMSNFEHWGHFSQIVWKKTTEVGCATQHCSSGLGNTGSNVPPYFTVCNYRSPGNMAGAYGENVGKPLGHPTITAKEG